MNDEQPGRFITLEGGEGAGKTTQVECLAQSLRNAGIDVLTTREPGGSPGAEEIRALLVTGPAQRWDPLTEALLHVAARRDHVERTIRPALAAGSWVISDRFADSTIAYQGYGLGVDRTLLDRLHALAIGDLRPDLTIVLDLPAKKGLERAGRRGEKEETRYEGMDLAFHQRLREGFLALARGEPRRCAVVDADRPVEVVAADIRAIVARRLGVGKA